MVKHFESGAWLVELGQLEDSGMVASAVAAVLGVRQHASLSMADSVAAEVGGRHLLVILDNCEHVVEAAAGLTATPSNPLTYRPTAKSKLHGASASRL